MNDHTTMLALSRLADARIELEDHATEAEPETVSLRFGDDHSAVVLQGDLLTVQQLVVEAERQLSHLHDQRRSDGPSAVTSVTQSGRQLDTEVPPWTDDVLG